MTSSFEINENIFKKFFKKLISYTGYKIIRENNFNDRSRHKVQECSEEDN